MRGWPLFAAFVIAASPAWSLSETQERDLRRAIAEADRGTAALEKGNTKKAREAFERSLAAVPDFPQGHLGLGHLAMRDRRFEDALREFKAAERAYQDMSSIVVELAAARYARSRDELQDLRGELAQLDLGAMQTQLRPSGTGTTQKLSAGQIERARALVRARIQALEAMNPPSATAIREAPAEVLFFQGNALFDLKRTGEAIAAWEEALRRDPKQPLAENNLAVAYWMTGRLQEAQAAMARSETLGFKVNPNFRADLERALASSR